MYEVCGGGGGGFSTTIQHFVETCIKPDLPIVVAVQGNLLSVKSSWISHFQSFITVLLFDDRFIIN